MRSSVRTTPRPSTLLRRLGQNTVDKIAPRRPASRSARPSSLPTALAISTPRSRATSSFSRTSIRRADLPSRRSPTSRKTRNSLARGLRCARARAEARRRRAGARSDRRAPRSPLREARGSEATRSARSIIVRKADLEDFDALTRLCASCARSPSSGAASPSCSSQRIEIEADEQEVSGAHHASSLRHLARPSSIAVTRRSAPSPISPIRASPRGAQGVHRAWRSSLGWKGIVATKLVEWWFEARHGAERTANLRGAFDRFSEVGRDQDAVRVSVEIVRSKGADKPLAEKLEELAIKTGIRTRFRSRTISSRVSKAGSIAPRSSCARRRPA